MKRSEGINRFKLQTRCRDCKYVNSNNLEDLELEHLNELLNMTNEAYIVYCLRLMMEIYLKLKKKDVEINIIFKYLRCNSYKYSGINKF